MPNPRSRFVLVAALLATCQMHVFARTPSWQGAIEEAARKAPEARIVVLDIATNRLLNAHHLDEAARTLAAPGSTLKPLILYQAITSGLWNAGQRIACSRGLMIEGHRLACSHPAAAPFNGQEALTWSCNSYFASVARVMRPHDFGSMLRVTGLLQTTGLAQVEARADFHEPGTPSQVQLAALGVAGIRVTPLELAKAYRWLALEMAAHPTNAAATIVKAGLIDSARLGMAEAASLGGVPVAGKTGTAAGASSNQTHGWFVGLVPAAKPETVIVVYLPAGRGADAARVAGLLLADAPVAQER